MKKFLKCFFEIGSVPGDVVRQVQPVTVLDAQEVRAVAGGPEGEVGSNMYPPT